MFNHVIKVDDDTFEVKVFPDGQSKFLFNDSERSREPVPLPGGVLSVVPGIGTVYDVLTEQPYTGEDLVYSAEWDGQSQFITLLKNWPEPLAEEYKTFDKMGINRRPHSWAGWPLPEYPEDELKDGQASEG